MIGKYYYNIDRSGILLCTRQDKESSISEADREELIRHLQNSQTVVIEGIDSNLCKEWRKIKRRAIELRNQAAVIPMWNQIRWIVSTDFEHPETIRLPLSLRLKHAKGIHGKLAEFKFYQRLHKVKEFIVKRNI